MGHELDWKRLFRAQIFYQNLGFTYLETNWTVPPDISAITKPAKCRDFYIKDRCLVASAEQSFLEIYDDLSDDLYYSLTPCFRDESVIDYWHQNYFMKLELFSKNITFYNKLCDSAFSFFESQLFPKSLGHIRINTIPISIESNNIIQSQDIVLTHLDKEIEVGSYLHYKKDKREWICGTGLAEPRFSRAIEFLKKA